MVGPGGVSRRSNSNDLTLQTSVSARIDRKEAFGAITNPRYRPAKERNGPVGSGDAIAPATAKSKSGSTELGFGSVPSDSVFEGRDF